MGYVARNLPGGMPIVGLRADGSTPPAMLRLVSGGPGFGIGRPHVTASMTLDVPATPSLTQQFGTVRMIERRAARYLAHWAGLEVPTDSAVTMEGLDFPNYTGHWGELHGLTTSERFDLADELPTIYAAAEYLLRHVGADSALGWAIENIGASSVTSDSDLRFLYAWNGVELLAKANQVRQAPTAPRITASRTSRPRDRAGPLVRALLREFHDGAALPGVPRLVRLRNGAAHGGLSHGTGTGLSDYLERWDKGPALAALARETLANYLGETGVLPKVGRPYRPTVMVWPDGRLEPVDRSATLSRVGFPGPELP